MAMNDREVTYEIIEEIGVISAHPTGWNKEINLVSWNGNTPKYDIRDWSPNHDQMGRGITLHEKEMRLILELLRRRPRTRARSAVRSEEPSFVRSGEPPFMEKAGQQKEPAVQEEMDRQAETAEQTAPSSEPAAAGDPHSGNAPADSAALPEDTNQTGNGSEEVTCGEGGMEWSDSEDAWEDESCA